MSFSEMHERRKGRNTAVMIILLCFVLLSVAVAFVKLPSKIAERREVNGGALAASPNVPALGASEEESRP